VQRDYARLSPEEQRGQQGLPLQDQISKLQTLQALQTGNAELVQRADAPDSPSSPQTTRNTILGAFLGLLVGGGLALLFERHDRRLRDPGDIEEAFSLPVLAAIPESKGLVASENNGGPLTPGDAESFRMLRTRLRYFNVDRDIRTVLLTSASARDGKTTVSWHLTRSAAESGARAILVEADFHRPTVAERRKIAPLPGLAELLSGQAALDAVVQQVPVESRANGSASEHHLDVIVAGATPPNAAQILESEEMAKLIEELSAAYDLVVIDTPPAGMIADAIPMMRLVDGVIAVGQLGKTTRDEAVHLRDQLRELGAPVLGVVATRVRSGRGYYGYGYAEDEGRRSGFGARIGRRT
jgi:capsular exopolysaccharide synthesis family protein